MPDHVAAGGVERGSAGVAGEVFIRRKAGNVADLTEDHGRGGVPNADDLRQRGAGRVHRILDPRLDGLELAVEHHDVVDVVRRELTLSLAGVVAGAVASRCFALDAVRLRDAPEGINFINTWWSRLTAWVRDRKRSRRLSESSRSATISSSVTTRVNSVLRSATIATARASVGSILRSFPVVMARTRVDNFGGTSMTVSPPATNRCASCLPTPPASSTAQTRREKRRAISRICR